MNGLLLALFLIHVAAQNTGAVTGTVRGTNGMPAPGIRVYAMTVRDATEAATAGTALDSIAQTDASGRYRLEVAAGRYYIASGSVGSPTYYPGTTDVAAARVVSIAAGGLVESIDFSSFVPASRTPGPGIPIAPLPPGSTGVLGGTIRFPDGQPAAQMPVVAIPAAAFAGPAPGLLTSGAIRIVTSVATFSSGAGGQNPTIRRVVNGYNIVQALTDASGRYRLENMPPETYYIATGYADSPLFFPGTPDLPAAKTFVTTPTTMLDTVDFTAPRQAAGVRVTGRVTALGGAAAAGATVELLRSTPAISNFTSFGLPNRTLNTTATVNPDGTFSAQVLPGTYAVDARALGVRSNTRNLTVTDQPITGLELSIPIAMLSGRILLEDGSALPNPQLLKEAVVTTVINPNLVASTILPIAADGTFSRFVEASEYRFYLGNLPDEYTIKSVTSGTQNLLNETLKITPTETVNIEIRVGTRTGPLSTNGVKVSGSVRDSFTGLPVSAERVTLCCLESGPAQRLSTPLRLDGSFEFSGVPRGRYELGLQARTGQPYLYIVAPRVDVADSHVSELTLQSTSQLGRLMATVVFENGVPLPSISPTAVVFTGATGQIRVVAQRNPDGGYSASVPAGDQYNVSLTNLPDGYTVKAISAPANVPLFTQANPAGQTLGPAPVLPVTAPITITIGPSATPSPR